MKKGRDLLMRDRVLLIWRFLNHLASYAQHSILEEGQDISPLNFPL